jgi:hypothetical protein
MKTTFAVLSLLLVASSSRAADPTYIDQLVETPAATLQGTFTGLKGEGCYQLAADRFLLIDIDKKDQKPWRVLLMGTPPCRRPIEVPAMDVHSRSGVELGQTGQQVIEHLGQPNATSGTDKDLRRIGVGDMEYFYICRVSDGCARHTSVYLKEGVVTAIAEWYSQ